MVIPSLCIVVVSIFISLSLSFFFQCHLKSEAGLSSSTLALSSFFTKITRYVIPFLLTPPSHDHVLSSTFPTLNFQLLTTVVLLICPLQHIPCPNPCFFNSFSICITTPPPQYPLPSSSQHTHFKSYIFLVILFHTPQYIHLCSLKLNFPDFYLLPNVHPYPANNTGVITVFVKLTL